MSFVPGSIVLFKTVGNTWSGPPWSGPPNADRPNYLTGTPVHGLDKTKMLLVIAVLHDASLFVVSSEAMGWVWSSWMVEASWTGM